MFNKNIVSCGITGKFGSFHTIISINFGTKIRCGLNFFKNGGLFKNLPIFSSSIKCLKINKISISIIFIPYYFCKNIILENIFSGIKIIICITENINVYDMLKIKFFCNLYKILFIGPNTPGVSIPELKIRLGLFPIKIIKKGNIAILSRSGTLIYEILKIFKLYNKGHSICIGIGGDLVPGVEFIKLIKLNYVNNSKKILIIGEIGGDYELELLMLKNKKKIFFYICGVFSPLKKKMGHAGAINNINNDVLKKIKKIKKKFLIINKINNINLIL